MTSEESKKPTTKKVKQKPKSAAGKKIPKRTGDRKCRLCGNARGIIHSYGLHICRRCFREIAPGMGFSKY